MTNKGAKGKTKGAYETIKQQHQIVDLAEYGIKVILVDDHSEATEISKAIVKGVYGKNILIIGAFENESIKGTEKRKFAEALSIFLIEQNYKLFTGYGKNF